MICRKSIWATAQHCWLSHWHPTEARMCQWPLSASCQTQVQVSKAKRANTGYILSVCWTFIYFLTLQQETALLCSSLLITGCLLLLGVIIFSILCLLVSKYSKRERGTVLCGSFSVTWLLCRMGKLCIFFFFLFFIATLCSQEIDSSWFSYLPPVGCNAAM